jgi:hypothetical protein
MLMSYVGEDKFVRGVSIYLKKHLYASTVSQDLWDGKWACRAPHRLALNGTDLRHL